MTGDSFFETFDQVGFALARMLLGVLWQSSILFVAVAGLTWLLRRRPAAVRHTLWVLALLVTPLIPLLDGMIDWAGVPQASVPIMPAYVGPPAELAVPLASAPPPFEPMVEQALPPQPAPISESDATPAQQMAPVFRVLDYPWALGTIGYLLGVCIFLVVMALGHIRIRQWLRSALLVSDERTLAAFDRAKETLGVARTCLCLQSGLVPSILVVGVIRPAVLVPPGFAEQCSDTELRAAFIHELSHVKRHDLPIFALIAMVRTLLFFHPLVWLAARQISLLAEQVADDSSIAATGEPLAYAKTDVPYSPHG